MSSLHRARRADLLAWAGAALLACAEPPPGPGDAGVAAAGPDARPETGGSRGAAAITFEREGHSHAFRGDDQIVATCAGGHRGIEAERQGERFALNAFITKTGVYDCRDPQPFILFLFASSRHHTEYGISAVEPGGRCTLRVTSLAPRFTGSFEATLARRRGNGPGELALSEGRFDVPFPSSPECPSL